MRRSFVADRSNRRDFLRVSVASIAGIALVEFVAPKEVRASGMYSGQVSQSSDDAEQLNSSDDVDLTDTTLHLKDKWSDYVGVRFQNVTVPAGATITSATLTWELVVAPISASNSIQIYGELSVNSATFQVNQYDISNRTRTSQYTRWDVPDSTGTYSITTNASGDPSGSDLGAVIQEIINQSGWASGNALSLIIDTNDSSQDAQLDAYDGSTMNAASLVISY